MKCLRHGNCDVAVQILQDIHARLWNDCQHGFTRAFKLLPHLASLTQHYISSLEERHDTWSHARHVEEIFECDELYQVDVIRAAWVY